MSQFQSRQAVAGLCQSIYSILQQLNPTDADNDVLQGHLDEILTWSNVQTKDAKADTIDSVDKERKKKKKDKDNKNL